MNANVEGTIVLDGMVEGTLPGVDSPETWLRDWVNLASQAGREDWVAVRLQDGAEGCVAEPIFGKSNLIFTLARAEGLVRIPPDANGLSAGEIVEGYLI